jgi:hypothetical protein
MDSVLNARENPRTFAAMNALLPSLIFLASMVGLAQARVGETRAEIQTRYGDGRLGGKRVRGTENYKFEKNGFEIEVSFKSEKSIYEMFHRKDQTITDDDIKELLKVNATKTNAWRFDKRENRWERGGKPKLVAYREPGHPDYFVVKDLEACLEAEKADKTDKSKTEGF